MTQDQAREARSDPQGEASAALSAWTAGSRNVDIIFALTDLGVPDALEDGGRTVAEIAEATGAHAPSLARVLRAIGDTGLFAVDGEGRYSLTPLSSVLCKNNPWQRRPMMLWGSSPPVQRAWASLGHTLRTGESAFKHANGAGQWEYYDSHPADRALFDNMLSLMRPARHAAVVDSYDFAGVQTIVDVGAGYGQLLAAILKAHPDVRGVAYDSAPVLDGAARLLANAGLLDRCELEAGDFFASVPANGNCYLLSDIIHDWPDAQAVTILSRCREAMAADSRLLIIEYVMPDADPPQQVVGMDMMMLVMYGQARQRTKAEFEALFAASGLVLSQIIPTADAEIVEAVPA